jgi:tRNA pseudouridine38-40 synthase
MPRIALGVEYDGSAFAGWQRQVHARSVQGELELALARVADHDVHLTAAGRTDAGVHALMQVAHFDATVSRPLQAWVLGGSAGSPPDLSVLWAREMPDSFHARFSAQSRTYLYRILSRRMRPALDRARVCWVRRPLDASAMRAAARAFLGEHDFSSFRASECQSSTPMRRVMHISVEAMDGRVEIGVTANAFLHHMVRNIAGVLIAIGTGDRPVGWAAQVLAARDRREAGITAPPQGLYLVGAQYPADLGLPSQADGYGRLPPGPPGAEP